MTRTESRAHTARRVLDAAERLFEAKGFAKVSVAEIAEAAGYSTGAVYANFPNKEALFLTVSMRRRQYEESALAQLVRAAETPAELLDAISRWFSDIRREHAGQVLVDGELWLMQGRNPLLREQASRDYGATQGFATLIIEQLERLGIAVPERPKQLASLLSALRSGIDSQRWFDPRGTGDETFTRGVAILLGISPDLATTAPSNKDEDDRARAARERPTSLGWRLGPM